MGLTREEFIESTEVCPVIAAVKDYENLEKCRELDNDIIYILFGDICNIADIVKSVKDMGKKAIVHIDLITGLGSREISVDYIKEKTLADGIISTKPFLIKRANELDLFTIQRFFMIDYITFANITKHVKASEPDVVELLPAGLPKVIRYLCDDIERPVVASGLILDKEDIIGALGAGAIAVSTTNRALWDA